MSKLDETAKGVFIISATPFGGDGALDLASADALTDFYIETGVDGITILGMMGEAPKLTFEESVVFIGRVIKRAGPRVPIVVGVSAPGMGNLASLAHVAMDKGAAGVMVAPNPGLNTDDKIYGFFEAALTALGPDVPVVLQDYPQTLGVHFSVSLLVRLFADFPQLVVLKHEDCPGLTKISGFRQQCEAHNVKRASILVGNGALYYDQELLRGVDGAMTGFAYPEMLVGVYEKFSSGDVPGALDLFDAYLPLTRYEQQPGFGLAVRKYVLYRRGIIKSPATRAPGPRLDEFTIAELQAIIGRVEQKLAALG
jgi:4-hydroxy-tetrahydrodipicolinate synthase